MANTLQYVVTSDTVQAFVAGVYAGDLSFSLYRNRPDSVEIDAIVVEPPFRNVGVGRGLVRALGKHLHRFRPAVHYAHADFASRASLRMMIGALGPAFMLDNDIRCLSLEEALGQLPPTARTSQSNGKIVIEGSAPIHGAFWIGKGARPKKNPFHCD